ncbi:DUF4321 domain-containing protein [Irregularibacter muris]|uniref:DUF4321 domain-containing protein n=1 Tax=Irregularibacter muris TaxID=1796619 RepID=A0AAE3L0G7_9FIRM|nr:DUF4321 domain-containing protein [Irregularibacter muris]MCR1899897.1 DUF4321 domain-containing protein [Irregularibacter muris]
MKLKKSPGIFIVTMIATMLIGTFVGNFLKEYIGIFGYNYPISILNPQGNPWNILDLDAIKLSFGLMLHVNLGSILGIVLGLYIFYKK